MDHRVGWLVCALLALTLASCGGTSSDSTRAHAGRRGTLSDEIAKKRAGEQESTAALGRADCASLRSALARRTGISLTSESNPAPPHSTCALSGAGVSVYVYLDSAYEAHQRFHNRLDETVQFSSSDPAKLPHPVAGVGDPAPGNANAYWLPVYASLYALRGNRSLTVAYALAGVPQPRLKAGAAQLAREAFRLSASR